MADTELLPCPFCRSSEITVDLYEYGGYTAYCGKCEAEGPRGNSPSEAAFAWNRRAQPEGEAPQAVAEVPTMAMLAAMVGHAGDRGIRMTNVDAKAIYKAARSAATLSPLCGAQHPESGKERGSIEDYNEFNRLLGNWGQSSWGGSADEIDSTKAYGDLVEYIDAWSYRRATQLDGGQEGSESNG